MITKQFAYRKETRPFFLRFNSHCGGWLFTDDSGERLFVSWASVRDAKHLDGIIAELKAKEPGLEVIDLDTAAFTYRDSKANRVPSSHHCGQDVGGEA